jgi:hypothetical protein
LQQGETLGTSGGSKVFDYIDTFAVAVAAAAAAAVAAVALLVAAFVFLRIYRIFLAPFRMGDWVVASTATIAVVYIFAVILVSSLWFSHKVSLPQKLTDLVALSAPRTMREAEITHVDAVLAKNISPETIEDLIRRRQPPPIVDSGDRQPDLQRVEKVFPILVATLSGIGFKIDPSGPQQREITTTKPANWSWQIQAEANSGGVQSRRPGSFDF